MVSEYKTFFAQLDHNVLQKILFLKRSIYYVYNILSPCMSAHQKRAPDLIMDGCEPSCGYWELNSGSLKEQSVLLTSEPSLQPPAILNLNCTVIMIIMIVPA